MIKRLTLNLRMYNPAANHEFSFATLSLRFAHSQRRVDIEKTTGDAHNAMEVDDSYEEEKV